MLRQVLEDPGHRDEHRPPVPHGERPVQPHPDQEHRHVLVRVGHRPSTRAHLGHRPPLPRPAHATTGAPRAHRPIRATPLPRSVDAAGSWDAPRHLNDAPRAGTYPGPESNRGLDLGPSRTSAEPPHHRKALMTDASFVPTPSAIRRALRRATDGVALDATEAETLLHCRGAYLDRLLEAAGRVRDAGLMHAGRPG